MDTRTLAYVGLGVLVGIVVATLIGIPPVVWITVALVALGVAGAFVLAQSNGTGDAERMLAREPSRTAPVAEPATVQPARSSAVDMELVRASGPEADTPAVWLHRRGGRRVHRFHTADGWIVERVSTKDPDNPRKRVIGEPLTLASEVDAITVADELAQGQDPTSILAPSPSLAPAKA